MSLPEWIGLLLLCAAWFAAAADAFEQKPTYGFILLFLPLLYPIYALAFLRRPAAAASFVVTAAVVACGLLWPCL